jgi:hypothetical protein
MHTYIHASSGTRTHEPSVRMGEDRPRGQRDRYLDHTAAGYFTEVVSVMNGIRVRSLYSVSVLVWLQQSKETSPMKMEHFKIED